MHIYSYMSPPFIGSRKIRPPDFGIEDRLHKCFELLLLHGQGSRNDWFNGERLCIFELRVASLIRFHFRQLLAAPNADEISRAVSTIFRAIFASIS